MGNPEPSLEHAQGAVSAVMAASAGKATQIGAGTTIVSWLVSSEAGVAAGIVIGLMGLLMNWHYRRKEFRIQEQRNAREQAEYEARMRQQYDQQQ